MNICVSLCMDLCFHFFGLNIYRSGMAASYGRYKFNFLRNSQVIFQSDCTILHSNLQCMRVPGAVYCRQHLV